MNLVTRNPIIQLIAASIGLIFLSIAALGMAAPSRTSDWMHVAQAGQGALRAFVDERLIDCDKGMADAPMGFSRQ